MKYNSSLDGLRAIAAIVVVCFHGLPSRFPGGFIGVDVFFVLSGFLISTLLSQEFDRCQTISIRNFYVRRALRLVPCLWLVLGGYAVFAAFVPVHESVTKSCTIAALYLMNWTRAFGIFNSHYLGHTWSLAIEEQFYLLWPILMLLFYRNVRSQRRRFVILLFIAVLASVYRFAVADVWTDRRIFNGLDTRFDGLFYGAALSSLYLGGYRRYVPGLSWIAAATLLGFVAIARHGDFMNRFGFTLSALSSGVVIWECVCGSESGSLLFRFLTKQPLVWIGRTSYGLYLWHYPIFRALKVNFPQLEEYPAGILVVGSVAALAISAASYILIERPIIALKSRFTPAVRTAPKQNAIAG